jgi:hypothetical protein
MPCNCTNPTPSSPSGEQLPEIYEAATTPGCSECASSSCEPSCAGGGASVPTNLLDAGCYSENVTLLGRVGLQMARLKGSGFIRLINGKASVVKSVPLVARTLWHRWWKQEGSVTPILGEPLPYPHLVVADSSGNIHSIKGSDEFDSVPFWDASAKEFRNEPLADIPWEVPDGSITTAKLANGAVTTPKLADSAVTTNKIANGAVTLAKLASGVANSLPVTSTGSTVARTLSERFSDVVNILDFGASPDADPEDNSTAIQAALDYAAGKARVFIPAGEFLVDATLIVPSDSYIFGFNSYSSVIKMASSVGRDTTVIRTGTRGSQKRNIVIEDITVDFNRDRWTVTGGERELDGATPLDTNQIALCISNSEYVVVRGVRAIDGYKHCLDVQAPLYVESELPHTYDSEPSRYVWIEDCYFSGGGDDNLTTHFSSDIWISRCVSENPSGVRVPNNSNCYEIDDGSRNVYVNECVAIGGICGIQVKGHHYAPAPYNVVVDGFRAINCTIGVEMRHTQFYGDDTDEDGSTEVEDEDGNEIIYSGASATARNVSLSNIEVIAPRSKVNDGQTYEAKYGIRIRSYENVSMVNVRVSDGSLDLAGDYADSTELTGSGGDPLADPPVEPVVAVVRLYGGCQRIQIQNLVINGFSTIESGLRTTSSFGGDIVVDGFICVNGPLYPIRMSNSDATYKGRINSFTISGDQETGIGVYVTSPNVSVGPGSVTGYAVSVSGTIGEDGLPLSGWEIRRRARSVAGDTIVPQEAASFVWVEYGQDLQAGEGLALTWKCRLEGDSADRLVGFVAFEKANGTDTSSTANFAVWISADGGTTFPVRCAIVKPGGIINLPLTPTYANDSAAGSGGLVAGDVYKTSSGELRIKL